MTRRTTLILTLAASLALLCASLAGAGKPKNGGFESGTFKRWQVDNFPDGSGDWFVYSGTEAPPDGDPFFAAPQGTFAAVVSVEAPGLHILHRKLKLIEDAKHKLKLWVYYENEAAEFQSPPTLDPGPDEGGPPENQQYRIDVLRKNAPIDSVDDDDILKEIFATSPGDPFTLAPTKVRAKLTRFAGKKVRLRIAEVDNLGELHAAVDGVKLKSREQRG